jgi:hypothetical protein
MKFKAITGCKARARPRSLEDLKRKTALRSMRGSS